MDWELVIERNGEALKRILASLLAMAGLAGGAGFTSPLWGGRRSTDRRVGVIAGSPPPPDASRRPPHKGEVGPEFPVTLPRHLHRAVLRLLRPAEAAVRRLVIVAARDVVVEPPRPRLREIKPDLKAAHAVLRRLGIAIVMSPADFARAAAEKRAAEKRAAARARAASEKITLPLFDAIRIPRPDRPRYVPAHAAPRIICFDGTPPHRLPPPPSPSDQIDATRLALRFQAIASALDDLPGHAKRFARWRARMAQNPAPSSPSTGEVSPPGSGLRPAQGQAPATEGVTTRRFRRISPLRPGRPPGLSAANRRRPSHEVHQVLADLQYFAREALKPPDTS